MVKQSRGSRFSTNCEFRESRPLTVPASKTKRGRVSPAPSCSAHHGLNEYQTRQNEDQNQVFAKPLHRGLRGLHFGHIF